ncbi:MAG: GNAT family N-acetyltransferase [Acetobacteraceae bacterium]
MRDAIVELQDCERHLHASRLAGEDIADRHLDWMQQRSNAAGVSLVAEVDGTFAGFVAGWIGQADNIAETIEANRFGLISYLCVLPAFLGRRIATRLPAEIERHLRQAGIVRLRINALASNASAHASYRRAGCVPYEILHEKPIGSVGDE